MTLKDAVNEAMREWVTRLDDTHYLIGSAIGPHPFPTIVRDFQRIIGREIKSQFAEKKGKLPDAVVACVGGGSNAIGTFYDFIPDKGVRLIGVEAGGHGIDTPLHSGMSPFSLLVVVQDFQLICSNSIKGCSRCCTRCQLLHHSIQDWSTHPNPFHLCRYVPLSHHKNETDEQDSTTTQSDQNILTSTILVEQNTS